MRALQRLWALVAVLAALTSWGAKPRVLVDAPAAVSKFLVKTLGKKFTPTAMKRALPAQPTAKEVTDVTRDLGAIAVVQATLEGGQWSVRVLNGADGTPLGTVSFKNAKKLVPPKTLGAELEAALRDAKAPGAAAPPPVAAPGPTPEPEQQKPAPRPEPNPAPRSEPAPASNQNEKKPDRAWDAEPETPVSTTKPMALRLGVGFTAMSRNYAYRDDLFSVMAQYRLPIGPAAQGELELYPGAFFTSGLAANFGLEASYHYVLGVSSTSNNVKFASTSMRLRAGAVGRIPLGAFEVNIGLGYALQTFSIAAASGGVTRPNIPNVGFGGLRPSLGGTVHFTPVFHLHFGGAYQVLLSKGEFGSSTFFPRATGGGADFWVSVGVRPVSFFEIRMQGDYGRYFFSLKPEVGDPYIVGGALDQYVSGTITANVVF